MGYRGKVAIAMEEKDYQNFVQKIEALKVDDKELCERLTNLVFDSPDENYIVEGKYRILYWEEIKWYEGDDDIDYVMDYLRGLTNYQFVNKGFDWEDIEGEGDLDLIYPVNDIGRPSISTVQ